MGTIPPGGDDDEPEDDATRAGRTQRFQQHVAFEAIDAGLGIQYVGRAVQRFGASGGDLDPAQQRDFWDRAISTLDGLREHLERLRDKTLS